jgi:predicted nuclease of predicted toxin-antitoxin system
VCQSFRVNLASALRKRGYDAIHVQELDRKGLSDREQLKYAIEQQISLSSLAFTRNL